MPDGKIVTCNCPNAAQDKLYGKNNRLANACKPAKAPGEKWYRCTVCKKEYQG